MNPETKKIIDEYGQTWDFHKFCNDAIKDSVRRQNILAEQLIKLPEDDHHNRQIAADAIQKAGQTIEKAKRMLQVNSEIK